MVPKAPLGRSWAPLMTACACHTATACCIVCHGCGTLLGVPQRRCSPACMPAAPEEDFKQHKVGIKGVSFLHKYMDPVEVGA